MTKARTLDDLSDVFLLCRTYGHEWEPQVTYVEQHGRQTLHRAVLSCGREGRAGVEDPSEKELLSYASGNLAGLVQEARYRYANLYLTAERLGRGRSRPNARLVLNDRVAVPGEVPA